MKERRKERTRSERRVGLGNNGKERKETNGKGRKEK